MRNPMTTSSSVPASPLFQGSFSVQPIWRSTSAAISSTPMPELLPGLSTLRSLKRPVGPRPRAILPSSTVPELWSITLSLRRSPSGSTVLARIRVTPSPMPMTLSAMTMRSTGGRPVFTTTIFRTAPSMSWGLTLRRRRYSSTSYLISLNSALLHTAISHSARAGSLLC